MNQRNKDILLKRGKPSAVECIDSNCDKVQEIDLGMSTTLIHCKIHGYKDYVAGKIQAEVIGAGNVVEVKEANGANSTGG